TDKGAVGREKGWRAGATAARAARLRPRAQIRMTRDCSTRGLDDIAGWKDCMSADIKNDGGLTRGNSRGTKITFVLFVLSCLSCLAAPQPAFAQDPMAELRRELAVLRVEIQDLRNEVATLKGLQVGNAIDIVETQVAELAQTKVESTTRMPVKLFGAVHAGVFANSANEIGRAHV